MRVIYDLTQIRKGLILFLHGFLKDTSTWNVTESGKSILIQEQLSKKYATGLVQFEEHDYLKPVTMVSEELYIELSKLNIKCKITIVAHSLAAFYAICLVRDHQDIIKAVILIDPTAKTQIYYNHLKNAQSNDSIHQAKLSNYSVLPEAIYLPPRIIIKIYLAYPRENIEDVITYYEKMVKNNISSDIILCPGRSHMLHYEIPAKFIQLINEL